MPTKDERFKVGTDYEVPLVKSWWLRQTNCTPEWLPVMGLLHEDAETFQLHSLHYDVDPRFLGGDALRRTRSHMRQLRAWKQGPAWHPAYQQVLANFPDGDPELCFTIADRKTHVKNRRTGQIVDEKTVEWGLRRIPRVRRMIPCTARLPKAQFDSDTSNAFLAIRAKFPNACGDICPHKGYDLRNIPSDKAGYRQCPLHQLAGQTTLNQPAVEEEKPWTSPQSQP